MVDWELVAQLDQLLGVGIGIDYTRVCAIFLVDDTEYGWQMEMVTESFLSGTTCTYGYI